MKNFVRYFACTASIIGFVVIVAMIKDDDAEMALFAVLYCLAFFLCVKHFKPLWRWYYRKTLEVLSWFTK